MKLIDGKATSLKIQDELKTKVNSIINNGGKRPHLAAVLIGDNGASQTYVDAKIKACERVGFDSSLIKKKANITEKELLEVIEKLNNDSNIDGYIVQLPLPSHFDEHKITLAINPNKDVDGFHPTNLGKMLLGQDTYLPATPYGIVELLKEYNISTEGKHCVVMGRSHIVGTPMSVLMSQNNKLANCTVTLVHSRTQNL